MSFACRACFSVLPPDILGLQNKKNMLLGASGFLQRKSFFPLFKFFWEQDQRKDEWKEKVVQWC